MKYVKYIGSLAALILATLSLAACGDSTHTKLIGKSTISTSSQSSSQTGKSTTSTTKSVSGQGSLAALSSLRRSLHTLSEVKSLTIEGTARGSAGTSHFVVSSASDNSCQGQISSASVGTVNFKIIGKLEYIYAGQKFWQIGLTGNKGRAIIPKVSGKWVTLTLKGENEFTSTCAIVAAYKTNFLLKSKFSGITALHTLFHQETVAVKSPGIVFTVSTVKPYYLLGEKTNSSNIVFSHYNTFSHFSAPAHSHFIILTARA
jgi:hypothetical protein